MQKLLLYIMVFPPIWGKKWPRSEHAHASYPGLFFRPPGFSRYMGREERRLSSGTGLSKPGIETVLAL